MCARASRERASSARRVISPLLMLLVSAAGCSDTSQLTEPFPFEPALARGANPKDFTVYTQNVYLGGDTGPIFSIDFTDLPALIGATSLFWDQVQASDVPERVTTIVDELDARRPHLVGLQEVFQFVEVDFASGSPELVQVIDLLAAIETEIAARALPYEVVAVQENTSTGASLGLPLSPTRILQFTDRVVALRRTDVAVLEDDKGNYAATFPLGPLTLKRGWFAANGEFYVMLKASLAGSTKTTQTGAGRTNLTINVKNRAYKTVGIYNVFNAFIIEYSGLQLNSMSSAVGFESIRMAYDYFTYKKA